MKTKQLLFTRRFLQRSRLASRVSALGLGRTQAAERRSTAHADRWCRMEFVHALDIRTACRSRLQPQGRWGRSNAKLSRGQSCMSLSSYSECNGHDLVLPDLPQLPAADSAYKSRCSLLDVMEASTRLINTLPLHCRRMLCWSHATHCRCLQQLWPRY